MKNIIVIAIYDGCCGWSYSINNEVYDYEYYDDVREKLEDYDRALNDLDWYKYGPFEEEREAAQIKLQKALETIKTTIKENHKITGSCIFYIIDNGSIDIFEEVN